VQNNHRIIIGDSRDMPELSDHTVQLIATSPPYWELKDYGHEGQIGFDQTYEAYINNLNLVWLECGRVLQDGCRLCINIGDQFARSAYYGRYKVIPIRTEIIRFCETIGFDYMGAIIWQKVTTCNTSGGASIMGSFPYPRNGILKIDYEFILIFRKPGDAPPVDKATKEASKLTKEEWSTYFNGHWNFPGERGSKHLAAFPQELPHRLIKMFSFVGDTVLDPFLGSGTTALAAKHLHRDSVGYELNAEFVPIIEEKIGVRQADMFDVATVQLEHRKEVCNFTERLERLPYHFHDPVTFERRVDPRSLQFGSRVYEDQVDTRDFYKVTGIMAPDLLELDNQLTVRLLGIKVAARHRQEAITFLEEKTKGHKVFFKLDATEFDDNGHLCCYLYLKNKTFLNAHLIKRGLAQADTDNMYRLRKRFMRYAEEAKSKT
jgi:site-specific DNA-methyltransferase (adenine-specific)